jgi:hypothetical protein
MRKKEKNAERPSKSTNLRTKSPPRRANVTSRIVRIERPRLRCMPSLNISHQRLLQCIPTRIIWRNNLATVAPCQLSKPISVPCQASLRGWTRTLAYREYRRPYANNPTQFIYRQSWLEDGHAKRTATHARSAHLRPHLCDLHISCCRGSRERQDIAPGADFPNKHVVKSIDKSGELEEKLNCRLWHTSLFYNLAFSTAVEQFPSLVP